MRKSGRKSLTLDYMFEGRRPRFYIGDFPDWSTNSTRERTMDLIAFAALRESESGPALQIAATSVDGRFWGTPDIHSINRPRPSAFG